MGRFATPRPLAWLAWGMMALIVSLNGVLLARL
jgi:manganese transport protein